MHPDVCACTQHTDTLAQTHTRAQAGDAVQLAVHITHFIIGRLPVLQPQQEEENSLLFTTSLCSC